MTPSPAGPVVCTRTSRPDFPLDALDPGLQQDGDSLIAEQLEHGRCDVGVFAAGQLRAPLDDGHVRAETAHGLGQFKPDVAAADHDEVLWAPIETEELHVGHRLGRREAGQLRHGRVGAQIQEHPVTADPAGTALGQLYVDGPGGREAGIAHDELGAASPVAIQMQPAHPDTTRCARKGKRTLNRSPQRV